MSALRIILLVFAVVLLAGIYWWGRRRTQPSAPLAGTPAPALGDLKGLPGEPHASNATSEAFPMLELPAPLLDEVVTLPEAADALAAEQSAAPAQKIVVVRLVAAVPRFSGAHLRAALEAESLAFGKYRIFHRTTAGSAIVFSVASMTEPGSFDPENMFHEQYPGIALFAQLPGPLDGLSMLNDLISCARKLQQTLGGVLQDEQGAALQAGRIEQLRREVRDFVALDA